MDFKCDNDWAYAKEFRKAVKAWKPTKKKRRKKNFVVPKEVYVKKERIPYADYLKGEWWAKRRNKSLQIADYKCEKCGLKKKLNVHHLNYARPGDELDEDLMVLCKICHEFEHFGYSPSLEDEMRDFDPRYD